MAEVGGRRRGEGEIGVENCHLEDVEICVACTVLYSVAVFITQCANRNILLSSSTPPESMECTLRIK